MSFAVLTAVAVGSPGAAVASTMAGLVAEGRARNGVAVGSIMAGLGRVHSK